MGKVVKLDTVAGDRPARGTRARRRPRRSKSALVLGGGGFTGGVYEIGALRALDLLSVNRTVNEFDVYVGTSAGSFVAAAVSNGVTPEEMMRVIVQQVPTPFPDASISSLLRPNYGEFLTKGLLVPFRVVQLLRTLVSDFGQMSAVDLAIGLAEALPSGIYSGQGIERYVRTILSDPDRKVLAAYGAFGEKKMYGKTVQGVIRSTFVVDEKGKIAVAQYNVKATGHVAKLRRDLSV